MSKNDELLNFIASIEEQISFTKDKFFAQWNYLFKSHLRVNAEFRIEKYVDIYGGFKLDEASYSRMDEVLKNFFDKRIKRDTAKNIYLRGYDYYQADPIMHVCINDYNLLWNSYREKWRCYQDVSTFSYLEKGCLSIEDWIGTLSLLEYIFADLTTLRWFEFICKNQILSKIGYDYFDVVTSTERFTEIIGESIAYILQFNIKEVYKLLNSYYTMITKSRHIQCLIDLSFDHYDKNSIRSVREGDSMCLIYAAYLMKLLPFCKINNIKRLLVVSNAFGAMNIGIILKYLMKDCCDIVCYNSLFYQNRAVEDEVYGGLSSSICCLINEEKLDMNKIQTIVIVDDSIFTGTSYTNLKAMLFPEKSVYLLPLTINCNCIKYCRRGISATDDINDIAHKVVKWASEVGNIVPAFSSFWDFGHFAPENQKCVDNPAIQSVLDGNDLLKKHLWIKYEECILQSC